MTENLHGEPQSTIPQLQAEIGKLTSELNLYKKMVEVFANTWQARQNCKDCPADEMFGCGRLLILRECSGNIRSYVERTARGILKGKPIEE